MNGSPLMKRVDGRWLQYGIVYVDFLGIAIYSRVPYYCKWIEETTGGEVKCQVEGKETQDLGTELATTTPPLETGILEEARCQPGWTWDPL